MSRIKSIKKKTHAMKLIEAEWSDSIENVLHFLYVEMDLPIRDVAEHLSISSKTAHKWLLMCDIKMKLKYEKMLEIMELRRKLQCSKNM